MTVTAFEVGAIFRIINKASPTLTAILRQVRALNDAIEKARLSLADLNKAGSSSTALTGAIAETRSLAAAWADVGKNAKAARTAIGSASVTAGRGVAAAAASAARGGGHGGGGGGIHGPGFGLPGGGHMHFGGAAAAAGGVLAYGAYEAAEMQKTVTQVLYHTRLPDTDKNRARIRKIITDAMTSYGFSLEDVGEALTNEVRLFQATQGTRPGTGLGVAPELLRAAALEATLKPGTSMQQAMAAMVGLAHMTKEYNPAAIRKLAAPFGFLSISNPASLQSMERAASYAVPIAQSELGIDPLQTLLLGTALARAGVTNTKSGTWLRQLLLRLMPGTAVFTGHLSKAHEKALHTLGLVDAEGHPLFAKSSVLTRLAIASRHFQALPMDERASVAQAFGGTRGSGAFAILSDPRVLQQVEAMRTLMASPGYMNQYNTFMERYRASNAAQAGRVTWQQLNVTLMDIGQKTLPSVTHALGDFDNMLKAIQSALPGGPGGSALVGARALEGAGAGAAIGAFGGPIGVVGGAAIGGALGVAEGYMEQAAKDHAKAKADNNPDDRYLERLKREGVAAPWTFPKIQLNLNIDGKTLAQAVSEQIERALGYPTTSAADGTAISAPPSQNYGH